MKYLMIWLVGALICALLSIDKNGPKFVFGFLPIRLFNAIAGGFLFLLFYFIYSGMDPNYY